MAAWHGVCSAAIKIIETIYYANSWYTWLVVGLVKQLVIEYMYKYDQESRLVGNFRQLGLFSLIGSQSQQYVVLNGGTHVGLAKLEEWAKGLMDSTTYEQSTFIYKGIFNYSNSCSLESCTNNFLGFHRLLFFIQVLIQL